MHVGETARLQIRLLGTFSALLDGTPLHGFRSAKVRALLAYLAVESERPHLREALATLLWGEYPERDAQRSLSQALTNLRSLLAAPAPAGTNSEPLLSVVGQLVQLYPGRERVWVDVHAFDSLLAAAHRPHVSAVEEPDVPVLLAKAVELYKGALLSGLSLPDSRDFEEWLMLHREQRHQATMLALERLVSHHLAEGRTEPVERYAIRQLALEPWSESGHQALMLAHALNGRRGAALQQYEACRHVLAEELGIEPSTGTEALARQIREGLPSQPVAGSGPPPAPFVARGQERARLDRALDLALAGQGRVVLVSGEAGTGKTALLGHFARHAQESHRRLIVAGGQCGAYNGFGDPFLPFREILQALAGETQTGWAGERGDPEQGRRLLALFPEVAEALLAEGPDLVGRLVSAESLAARAETLGQPGASWRARLADQPWRSRLSPPGKRVRRTGPLQQEALFEQVSRVFRAIGGKQPLLLLIDDLQWADAASLSLLFYLGRRLGGCRILVVGAYRPSEIAGSVTSLLRASGGLEEPGRQGGDGRHPLETIVHEFACLWGDIRVDLEQADGRRFVDALLDQEPNHLGEGFRNRLARHTGGHPLFTIELLRAFRDRGDLTRDEKGCWVEGPDLRWQGLPPRVEAVIAERVARLPHEARRLLAAGSVEGETFSAEVAARALGAEPGWAVQWLSGPGSGPGRLVQALGIQSLSPGGPPISRYRFAHALFQEYVYRRLDAVDRAHLHREVGMALAGLCRGDEVAVAQASPQLAWHYEEAGLVLEAARYRLEAGRWAARLVAYEEAIAHLERGLALLQGVPASREGLRLELRLCMALGPPTMLQRGWQAPAHTRALERLSELTQHPDLQDDPQCLTALGSLALSTSWSADPERSGRVGEQLLSLAQGGDRQSLMLAHWALGHSHWLRAQLVPAREHLARSVALYDPEANRPLGGLVAGDPGVAAHAMLGSVLWLLGYPDQGRACFRRGVVLAQALEQPASLAFAHFVAMMVTSALGHDVAAAQSHLRALRPLGQLGLVYGGWAELLAALAQAEDGQPAPGSRRPGREQGVARAVEALSAWQAAGSGAGFAGLLLLQARLCTQVGRAEMGLAATDQAQAWIERTGVRALEAEVWRMRGELLLALTPTSSGRSASGEEAEACFQSALAVARGQEARWCELGAALSLARLWQAQGRVDAARRLLAGIYEQFTEGFDTVDLVEAKALLGELA